MENLELAKTLIEAKANLNYQDHYGLAPLFHICKDHDENLELSKTLTEAGAHVCER